jgi:hypothetical protein
VIESLKEAGDELFTLFAFSSFSVEAVADDERA